MRHAVFATTPEHDRSRVTGWVEWNTAQDTWEALDNRRRAGELPHLQHLEVRSADDPKYGPLPHEPWMAVPVGERPKYVKLNRSYRQHLVAEGRKAGSRDEAADAVLTALLQDGEWSHLEAVTISDYAWGVANFCFPQEARYL